MTRPRPVRPQDHVWSEAVAFTRFLAGLPRFLRERMTHEQARATLLDRLARREALFLGTVQHTIYGRTDGPYRAMLAEARCEFGDLARLVRQDGIEPTLHALRRAGVYLSFEEFKGRVPIVRGGREIPARLSDFDNPLHGSYLGQQTSGSTGSARRVTIDLTYLRARLPHHVLIRAVQGTLGLPVARWSNLPPGGGLKGVLLAIPAGERREAWFVSAPPISWRFGAATAAALAVARASGARAGWPRLLPKDGAIEMARWGAARIREEGGCVLGGSVSRMVRVALAAQRAGIDLTGATVVGSGEPPTPAKVASIRRTGAAFRCTYTFSEVGSVGTVCLASEDPNEHHFFADHLALIQWPRTVPGFDLSVPAFCYTTLLPSAPKLLLNVESDDFGEITERRCGCEWQTLGLHRHLSGIRSFRKLTGEGVTLIGTDLEAVLEDVLPARCGGSALDYQLVETESRDGLPRLVLRVAPGVPLADEQLPIDVLLSALHAAGGGAALGAAAWATAGALEIRREAPQVTSSGKMMPIVPLGIATLAPASRAAPHERSVA